MSSSLKTENGWRRDVTGLFRSSIPRLGPRAGEFQRRLPRVSKFEAHHHLLSALPIHSSAFSKTTLLLSLPTSTSEPFASVQTASSSPPARRIVKSGFVAFSSLLPFLSSLSQSSWLALCLKLTRSFLSFLRLTDLGHLETKDSSSSSRTRSGDLLARLLGGRSTRRFWIGRQECEDLGYRDGSLCV